MDKPSPLTAASGPLGILPPQQHGSAPVNTEDFRALLATQGVKAPAGAVPTAAEAQIEAAQIAGKANVAMGVKRGPVLSGMQQPQPANIPAPITDRFLPLRQGPSAARVYSGPTQSVGTGSVDGLRATTKFGTGPVPNSTMKTSPVLTRKATPVPSQATINPAPVHPALVDKALVNKAPVNQAPVNQAPAQVAAPKAVEAYAYGLRAASENKAGQVPDWFDSAVQNGLDKYDALRKTDKKP